MFFLWNEISNKKVLLRECKRHSARRVASARSAVLFRGEGGVPQSCPCQGMGGGEGTPVPSWLGGGGGGTPVLSEGVLHFCPGGGGGVTPVLSWRGYPSTVLAGGGTLCWGTPCLGLGYLQPGQDWGTPPPPGVDRQTPVKTVPSPSFGCEWQKLSSCLNLTHAFCNN